MHNSGKTPCQLIFSASYSVAKASGLSGSALAEAGFEHFLNATKRLVGRWGKASDFHLCKAAQETSKHIIDDFAVGRFTNLSKVPSVAEYNGQFFSTRGGKVVRYKVDTEVHHIIPKSYMERWFPSGFDDVPGHVMNKGLHRNLTNPMNLMLKDAQFKALSQRDQALTIIQFDKDVGETSQQAVATAWFRSRGIIP